MKIRMEMMGRWPLLLAAVGVLAGCSSGGVKPQTATLAGQKPALIWLCAKPAANGSRFCAKRYLQNGQPINDSVYATKVIGNKEFAQWQRQRQVIEVSAMPSSSRSVSPAPNSGKAVAWSRQPLTQINALDDDSRLVVENLGPKLRATQKTVNAWEKPPKNSAKAPVKASPDTPRQTPTKKRLPQGYTVQLAAFSTVQKCKSFVSRGASRLGPVFMKQIMSGGKPWCIVTQGEYSSFAEAQKVAKNMDSRELSMVPWPRSWELIQALEQKSSR